MTKTKQLEWEKIADMTERLPVYGGWLVIISSVSSTSSTFVPDPRHIWKIVKEIDVSDCGH